MIGIINYPSSAWPPGTQNWSELILSPTQHLSSPHPSLCSSQCVFIFGLSTDSVTHCVCVFAWSNQPVCWQVLKDLVLVNCLLTLSAVHWCPQWSPNFYVSYLVRVKFTELIVVVSVPHLGLGPILRLGELNRCQVSRYSFGLYELVLLSVVVNSFSIYSNYTLFYSEDRSIID